MILSKVLILLCVHFIIIFSTSLSADTSCRLIDLQAAKAKNNVLEGVIANLKEEENSDISALIENPMCSEKEDLLEKWLINLKKARITLTDELGLLKLDRNQLELALASTRNEIDEARQAARMAAAQREVFESMIAALEQDLGDAEKNNAELRKNLENALVARLASDAVAQSNLEDAKRKQLLLKQAEKEIEKRANENKKTNEELIKAERQTALLNQQLSEVRKQLGELDELLSLSEERDQAQKAQLKNVGSRLNQALASLASEERKRRKLEEIERQRLEQENNKLADKAEKLASYKSEFFGRLRTILVDQDRVKIVGDRFIFSSEVLFSTGSAGLSPEGKAEISNVSEILSSIMKDIPENIDWIIRVDGHTDNIPVSGSGKYKDNWELSQARALSVVKYMITELGLSGSRLAANGFGEYQPISVEDTPEARALNRRIEIKLTER